MSATEATPLTANSVLPAKRVDIELHTADGLALVGELAMPQDRPPAATVIMLHPLPTHGGFMDSHVFKKAARRLPALGDLAVLRFNTRGTSSPRGTSEGDFDYAQSEKYDVSAAIDFAWQHELPRVWLVGWSFGTDLALMHGHDPAIQGAVLMSPPLRWTGPEHLQAWAKDGKPVTALIPEFDDYLRPAEAAVRFAAIPQARVVAIEGARHLWLGETYVRRAHQEIISAIRPDLPPLPTSWGGPMVLAPRETFVI
ncbi:MAG TPA: alpha/beta hydrolase [Dermatophilaceae bacterium]|nr:alpha/beta hydrolase [Dermatophilaceae bacterium]